VVTAPVEAFESYRAELVAIGQHLGLRRIRFLDEPVAAALGYGLGLGSRKRVLVVDFGAGTLDMAVVNLTPESAQSGGCAVEAKAGRALGGNVVDAWLVEDFCRRLDYALRPDSDEARLWQRLMLIEACRVKEALYFRDAVSFELAPPEELRRFEARLRKGPAAVVELRRQDLVALLSERGLYAALDDCLASVLAQTRAKGFTEQDIDEVLMVGGSSLLPQVYSQFESRFGRDRVRAWQPFEAVAYGACAYAADHLAPADFIVHDYALLTHDRRTQKPQHTIVVPNGTRFPTAPDLWKQRLVPACSLGEPESIFKLVICEIGEAGADDERRFAWDREGKLRKLGGQPEHQANDGKLVVKLNDADPALGTLDPPHLPSDQRPRLEVSFGVNAERWLCATVCDLFSDKYLMRDEPVVRLL
jgi:molecular chaperone DnaK (HSP70)